VHTGDNDLLLASGRVYAATFCQTDGERISAVYRVLNPEKLAHVEPAQASPGNRTNR
jgi:hypothetical protein